jgi:hypothetical protein
MIEWMSPLNFFQRQADILSNWQPGTGNWLFHNAQFKDWESSTGSVLWCRGIRESFVMFRYPAKIKWAAGAGKTVLACVPNHWSGTELTAFGYSSLVVNHLGIRASQENIGVACLYMNHKETDSQTPQNLLGGLLRQLLLKRSIPTPVHTTYEHHCDKRTKPTLEDLGIMLNSVISQYSKVYVVVDAMDEYPEESCKVLLQSLSKFGLTTNLMITSRPNISAESFFSGSSTLEIQATTDDIAHYVNQQISSSSLSKHIKGRPELHAKIKSTISSNAGGM